MQSQTISLILLTHATVGHLAAFAYCCKNFPRFTNIPVYATRPVSDLGRALLQDLYESTPLAATTISEDSLTENAFTPAQKATAAQKLLLQAPTSQELARYFSLIQPLKYSQPHQPLPTPGTPPLNGLTITAYNSGRTLGGTIWHIQHGLESIVYAVDWNLARENVFSGASWLGGAGGGGAEVIEQLRKPTALICSTRGAERTVQGGGRVKRDEQLIAMVKACVNRGGTALIPVDSSARVLELAYILEHAWRRDARERGPLTSAKLYLAGRSMSSTIRYARTMLEWMDDNINREFEAVQDNLRRANGDDRGKDGGPFDLKYAKIVERRAQIQKLLTQDTDNVQTSGRVILASDTSLEWGFSKDLLKGLARDSRNVLILTEKPPVFTDRPTLSAAVYDLWNERSDGVTTEQVDGEDVEFVYGGGRELEVQDATRQALEGDELALYQQYLAQRKLQENVQGGGAGTMEPAADAVSESSESDLESEESDSEQQGRVLNISATMGQARKAVSDKDLGVNILVKKKGTYDFDVEERKGRDRMFPLAVRRKRTDEFGEVIRPEEYLRAEEKGDDGGDRLQNEGEGEKLGKKRKWDDSGTKAPTKRAQLTRATPEEGTDEVDELDEVEDTEEEVTGPSRLVLSKSKIMVNLRLAYVDFSGLHDKRSLNMLIPLIQPRKLILVGGSSEETAAVAADCRKLLVPPQGEDNVFTPGVGEVVDASVDTNAWTLKLADALVKKLRWQSVRGLGIVTVTGRLSAPSPPPSVTPDSASASTDQKKDENPVLDVAETATQRTYQPLHVGDLRLADLRREMQAAGHTAEFRGEGTLLVDGVVAVRKTSTGRVEVAGVLGDGGSRRGTLYEVRKVIYRSLAVVGA